MKRIIDGKRYDTETATEVASFESHHYQNDFHHYEECLYMTKNERYFLHGSGGALSKYAISVGNNATGGSERIEVMSNEEAREWLVETENTEALEEHFGHMIEDG